MDTLQDQPETKPEPQKTPIMKKGNKVFVGMAILSGIFVVLMAVAAAVEYGFFDGWLGTASTTTVAIPDPKPDPPPQQQQQTSQSQPQDIATPEAWTSARVVRGVMLGGMAVVLVSVIVAILYTVLSARMSQVEDNVVDPEKPTEPIQIEDPQEADSKLERVYKWCQSILPPQVAFAASLCAGCLLSMLLATLYPLPPTTLAISLIAALLSLATCTCLFLPWPHPAIATAIASMFLVTRWYTWNQGTPVAANAILVVKFFDYIRKAPHLANAIVAVALFIAFASTWGTVEDNKGGGWAVSVLVAAAVMAALGQSLIGRQEPANGVSYVLLLAGVVASLVVANVFETAVVLEVGVTGAIWFFCTKFIV